MPSASILTKTSDQVVSAGSPSNINITWQTETQYLDAAFSFYAGANPDRLTIPAAMDGTKYEVFLWVEDAAASWSTGDGAYLGTISSGNITDFTQWWGIYADLGKASRGHRTGILDANALEGWFVSSVREFGSATMTASSSKCRFGVLQGNPNPLAMAACSSLSYSVPNGTSTLALPESFDVGSVYTGGTYTAPAGATIAVVNANGRITSETSGSTFAWELHKNASEFAKFDHAGSLRGYGPGTFGMLEVAPGDTLEIKTNSAFGGARTGLFSHSVEFY